MRSCTTLGRARPRRAVFRRFVKSESSPVGTSLETGRSARSVPNVTEVTPSARGAGMGARTRRRAVAAALVALMAIAGCTDARPNTRPTTSSQTATPTPTSSSVTPDPRASAMTDVLAAYVGFSDAASAAQRHPMRSPSGLKKFATDKALASTLATIALYRQQGIVVKGQATHDPQIVALSLDGDPATATIRDCVDITNVKAIYRETGKSALAPNQSQRHFATAQAVTVNGHWMIRTVASDRSRTC
jgi:hypothetical protein